MTMESMKKGVKVGDKLMFDMEKMYASFILIADKRNISLKYVLEFEMSPVPLALFDEYGNMLKTSKAQMIKKLAIIELVAFEADVTLIDGTEVIDHAT